MADGYTAVYGGQDLAEAGVDVGGNFLVALAGESATLAIILVAILVIVLVIALLKNVFGITDTVRGLIKR